MTATEITFDKLVYIDRLKSAGVDEPQARAHADALDHALRDSVATKHDLRDLGEGLRNDLRIMGDEFHKELRNQGDEFREELRNQGDEFRKELRNQGEEFHKELRNQGDEFRKELRNQGDELRIEMTRLDNKITLLDHKIEVVGRDLTIRMGGMLILLFGALASIKFFG